MEWVLNTVNSGATAASFTDTQGHFKGKGLAIHVAAASQVIARLRENLSWSAFQQKTIICEAWLEWVITHSFDPSTHFKFSKWNENP